MTITLSNIIALIATVIFWLTTEYLVGKLMESRFFPSNKTIRAITWAMAFVIMVVILRALNLNLK